MEQDDRESTLRRSLLVVLSSREKTCVGGNNWNWLLIHCGFQISKHGNSSVLIPTLDFRF